nr:hypothetical protein [Tolivirales sp.]
MGEVKGYTGWTVPVCLGYPILCKRRNNWFWLNQRKIIAKLNKRKINHSPKQEQSPVITLDQCSKFPTLKQLESGSGQGLGRSSEAETTQSLAQHLRVMSYSIIEKYRNFLPHVRRTLSAIGNTFATSLELLRSRILRTVLTPVLVKPSPGYLRSLKIISSISSMVSFLNLSPSLQTLSLVVHLVLLLWLLIITLAMLLMKPNKRWRTQSLPYPSNPHVISSMV